MIRLVSQDTFGERFSAARAESPLIARATSEFDPSCQQDTRFYLIDNAPPHQGQFRPAAVLHYYESAGFAVRPDGELVYVFSTVKGQGDVIVRAAIARGADHLDCFDGYLPGLYSRNGIARITSLPNWTPGGPDVVYMGTWSGSGAYKALAKAETAVR